MNKNCKHCKQQFQITDDDLKFYAKINVPTPTWCPTCREMRRMAWCNEGTLYQHTCGLTGQPIISEISPENPRPVYSVKAWWSDAWDPLDYGKEFDFSRLFFDQLHELELKVPHLCVQIEGEDINSDYTHHAGQNKNCYYIFHATFCEDCFYGYGVKKATNCVDVHYCHGSELCYECIDVKNSHSLFWCQDCLNCSSSYFLADCIGCMDCFMCTGLRNKKYCFKNQQLSHEEYKKEISKMNFGNQIEVEKLKNEFTEIKLKHTYRHLQNTMTENSIGDHLINAKNSLFCFDSSEIEDCKYVSQVQLNAKDSYDIYQFGINMECCYEGSMIGANAHNIYFSFVCLNQVLNLEYCINCHMSEHCFGCFGLKRKKYCILNKQYSKEDYFQMREQITKHMQGTGEYGEFLPIKYSQCAYNESTAQYWYPMTKEQVLQNGWQWNDNLPGTFGKETTSLPNSITETTPEITKEVLACATCKKNYRIIPQEFSFHKKLGLALPTSCFECRRKNRINMRNQRKFFYRKCQNIGCKNMFHTTYPPDDPRTVFCEQCYKGKTY